MATDRFHLCPKCGEKSWAETLFESLFSLASGKPHACPKCGTESPLHLNFAYGLEATGTKNVVLDCFLPDQPESWSDREGRSVTFYPFLAITETPDRKRGAWLPYWHVVRAAGDETKKYGQWAPSMDLSTFEELVSKARNKGYLK